MVRQERRRKRRPGTATRLGQGHQDEWLAHCQRNSEGNPRSNLANALVALREAPELQGLFSYDEMLRAPLLTKSVPGASLADPVGTPASDPAEARARRGRDGRTGMAPTSRTVDR